MINNAETQKLISISLDDADCDVWERALVMLYQFVDPAKFQMNSARGDTPARKGERRMKKRMDKGNANKEMKGLL